VISQQETTDSIKNELKILKQPAKRKKKLSVNARVVKRNDETFDKLSIKLCKKKLINLHQMNMDSAIRQRGKRNQKKGQGQDTHSNRIQKETKYSMSRSKM